MDGGVGGGSSAATYTVNIPVNLVDQTSSGASSASRNLSKLDHRESCADAAESQRRIACRAVVASSGAGFAQAVASKPSKINAVFIGRIVLREGEK